MNIPDIWSLLTGIASVISFFLTVGDRFASWRKYTVPAAAAFGGFAIGRISPSLSSGMDQLFGDPKAAGFILLLFMIIAAVTLAAFLLMRHGQTWLAYLVFMIGMISVPSGIMSSYSKIVDTVPAGDLVKLAQIKASAGEYEQAVKYLESAKDKTKSEGFKKELQNQIDVLLKEAAKLPVQGKTK